MNGCFYFTSNNSLGIEYLAVTGEENIAIMIGAGAVTDNTRVRFEISFDYLSSFA